MDESDRVVARIEELRQFVGAMLDDLDELLPHMTEDEAQELLVVLEGIARNRRRGGHSLN